MIVNKTELLEALKYTKLGLATTDTYEPAQFYHFDEDSIVTFNDVVYIEYPIETGITGAIKGNEFLKVISNLPAEEIDIEQDDEIVYIKCKKVNVELNLIQFDDFSKIKPKAKIKTDVPTDFWEAAKFCSFTIDKKLNHPQLSCLFISGDAITSCDNKRATRKTIAGEFENDFLLPATPGIFDKPFDKYLLEENWIHFTDKSGIRLSCRIVAGDYPDLERFFETEGDEFTLPEKLIEAIKRADILATTEIDFNDDKEITITIADKKITVKGEGSIGSLKESVRTKYKGDTISFSTHPDFLIEILPHLQKAIIGDSRMLFSGEGFDHVMAIKRK